MTSYAVKYEVIGGRDALLTATGHHPYVMLTTTGDVTGYRADRPRRRYGRLGYGEPLARTSLRITR